MAQNPDSSAYDGVPPSAIATGLVDYVLPPAEMPAQLIAYVAHAFGRRSCPISASTGDFEVTHEFEQIGQCTILRNARRILSEAGQTGLILLAIEDITGRMSQNPKGLGDLEQEG
jgi:hypothetical protein